ncbi:Cyclin-Y-like protein 2, partial [Plecturocebus cupreus]
MGNILTCCSCETSPKSDQDEGSGCAPESEICEAAAEDTTAAAEDTTAVAEDTTAAAPMAAAEEPAELTFEARKGLPVHHICHGEMPQAQEVGENNATNHFSVKFSSCSTSFLESSTASCRDYEITLRSLECSATNLTHHNLHLSGSSKSASASQVAKITIMYHHTQLILFLFFCLFVCLFCFGELRFLHVSQAGLEFSTSGDLPTSASKSAGIT